MLAGVNASTKSGGEEVGSVGHGGEGAI
jgi:hypothetical protein